MGVAAASGVGVFMGRFLRFNSWDVLWRPASLVQRAGDWVTNPFVDAGPYVFSTLFAVFVFIAYLMFYALTKLPSAERLAGDGVALRLLSMILGVVRWGERSA